MMLKNKPIRRIDKPWGWEEILEENERYVVKRLLMKKGEQCSYQYHEKKMETIVVLSGELTIIYKEREQNYGLGEVITINPFVEHRMAARDEDAMYLECSTPELEDVVRLKDDYGRK